MSDDRDGLDRFTDELQSTILRDALHRYGATVVEHWMNPRGWGPLAKPDGYGRYRGPCGDTMQVWLRVADRRIENASFMTDGCGSSIACGSAIIELVHGKTLEEATEIDQETVLTFLGGLPEEDQHCALLAATALAQAVDACTQRQHRREKAG